MSTPENKEVEKAQQLMKEMNNQLQRETQDFINNSFNAIVGTHTNQRIPEPVFRHHFLPHFSGNVETPQGRNVLAEWVGVAGSPMAKVDVVDENNNVLFTVPPVMDSSIINLNKVNGRSLSDLVGEYNLHKNHSPGRGITYLANNVQPKLQEIVPGHSDESQAVSEWSKVFNFYNLDNQAETSSDSKKEDSDGSEDLVYE